MHFRNTSCRMLGAAHVAATGTSLAVGLAAMATARQPSVFLSHGGGPCFFMDDEDGPMALINSKSDVAEWYRRLAPQLAAAAGRPRAIVIVSAHWESTSARALQVRPRGVRRRVAARGGDGGLWAV